MEEQRFEAGGFLFQDEETAKRAKKEIAGVNYLKTKVDMDNPEKILQIYNKAIGENLFQTPIGVSYLKELQEYLYEIPYIEDSSILSIPVYGTGVVPKGEKQKKQNTIDFRKRYQVSFFFAVIFFVMIVAMFAITLTSESPTILNYENKIINKYEEWEQELEQREQELNQREAGQNNVP